ncbi:FAD binding domain-containing protein [Glonium stellatum]|uniref:FAD binding domain-containing protein n=1 Tax=Glonium stellatum TaxID=574774 RepID=A0A8E2ESY2_9PEZI|nr:FAD binding domain-containing protein [Glonium stellatum]
MRLIYPFWILSVFLSFLIASVVSDTCSLLSTLSNFEIEYPVSADYNYDQTQYWSTGCSALKPSCIFSPTTAEEVVAIVEALHQNNETFAIKSGGHNPNQYFASVSGGPLISTRKMNEVTYNPSLGTVRIGPGNRWDDVQSALKNAGVTVVGGRIGNVGVGGYMLGAGGLSFLSAQYGWAANNVVEFEIVLSNATIAIASATSNPDLFKALKGGGNNYGIVTAYTMKARQQGQVWGGNLIFTPDKTPQLLAALRDFTEYYPDEKAGIIMTSELTIYGAVDLWIMFLFYDGPTPPAGVFDNFTDIGPAVNDCVTRSYYDLLSSNNWSVVRGSIYTIATETTTLPNSTVGMEVLTSYYDHWRNTTSSVLELSGLIGSVAFQPMPKIIARKAKEQGGDLLDLDEDVDRIILEFDYSYLFATDDAAVDDAMQRLYGGIRDRVLAFMANGTLSKAYLPLFMNDGYFREDYFGRLRTVDFARSVRDQYDPHGFFARRTGGFKM